MISVASRDVAERKIAEEEMYAHLLRTQTQQVAILELGVLKIDMIMPEMGGSECFTALKKIDPNVRAILASGYTMDDKVQKMIDDGALDLAQKPYQLALLASKVRAALKS
ncbi:response regulator [bacterium]|nr:response regulator [bacterium]